MRPNIQGLIDDAKCYDMVRELRWSEGCRMSPSGRFAGKIANLCRLFPVCPQCSPPWKSTAPRSDTGFAMRQSETGVEPITISFDELGIRDLPSIRAFAHCVRVTCKTYPKSEYFHLESRTPPTRWVYGSFGAATNVGIVELSVNLTPLIVRRTISSPE